MIKKSTATVLSIAWILILVFCFWLIYEDTSNDKSCTLTVTYGCSKEHTVCTDTVDYVTNKIEFVDDAGNFYIIPFSAVIEIKRLVRPNV